MPYIPYLPYIPNIPYFPNMPYQTDHTHHTYPPYHTTPPPHHRGGRGTVPHPHHTTGGGGGRSHMGPVYGTHPPHHRGGRGTVPHPHHTTGGGGGRSHMGPVYGTHPPHHRGGRGTVPHPHHTTGGGGGRSHMGPVYGTHPIWGGGGGGGGRAWCIYTHIYLIQGWKLTVGTSITSKRRKSPQVWYYQSQRFSSRDNSREAPCARTSRWPSRTAPRRVHSWNISVRRDLLKGASPKTVSQTKKRITDCPGDMGVLTSLKISGTKTGM